MREDLTDCLFNIGVVQPDLRKVAVSLISSIRMTWRQQGVMEVAAGLSYQDCLRERILTTIIVVDAVVRDLLTNLTANRAQHYHCSSQAEQAKLRGRGGVVEDDALILDLVLVP